MNTRTILARPDCCADCAGREEDCAGEPRIVDGAWECPLYQRDIPPADEPPPADETPASIAEAMRIYADHLDEARVAPTTECIRRFADRIAAAADTESRHV